MRTVAASRVVFALVLIGLVNGTFGPGWDPVPASMPVSQMFAYFSDLVYIGCGVGMLLRPTADFAARVLFVCLLLWLLLLRLPWLAIDPQVGTWWPASSTSVILGAAWTIYASPATEWDRTRVGFIVGGTGIRIARTLFGIGLIPLGLAHFIYLEATAPLVPAWMGRPVFWSYFTGAAFIAAGLAIIFGILPRFAAALVALQIGLLTVMVWLPRIFEGVMTAFQWNEFFVSILLTTCAAIVAQGLTATPPSSSNQLA